MRSKNGYGDDEQGLFGYKGYCRSNLKIIDYTLSKEEHNKNTEAIYTENDKSVIVCERIAQKVKRK